MIMSLVCDVCMEKQLEVTSTCDLREPSIFCDGWLCCECEYQGTSWCFIHRIFCAFLAICLINEVATRLTMMMRDYALVCNLGTAHRVDDIRMTTTTQIKKKHVRHDVFIYERRCV